MGVRVGAGVREWKQTNGTTRKKIPRRVASFEESSFGPGVRESEFVRLPARHFFTVRDPHSTDVDTDGLYGGT